MNYWERQADRVYVKPGLVRVFRNGQVWKVARFSTRGDGRIIKIFPRKRIDKPSWHGYRSVALKLQGKSRSIPAHRLIWQRFKGDIPDGFTINHDNGKKWDNRISNLEPMTHGDNNRHAFRVIHTRSSKGEHHSQHKLTDKEILEIRQARLSGASLLLLSLAYGISEASASLISRKLSWKHIK